MATKKQIVEAILNAAGNPDTGIIKDLADAFADAIIAIDAPVKEIRVDAPKETR
jgi:hypothetical protein